MGAIASGGVRVLNRDVLDNLDVSAEAVDRVAAREQRELARREEAYRGGQPPVPLAGRVAILVDDGMATGSSMRAALAAVRQRHPARVVVAVPTAAAQTCRQLEAEADEVVCALTPTPFVAVGLWYHDFTPTTDEQVRQLMRDEVPSEQS